MTETPHLKVVEVAIGDDDLLYQLTDDKEVMKFFPKVLNLIETKAMVHKILAQKLGGKKSKWVLFMGEEHWVYVY